MLTLGRKPGQVVTLTVPPSEITQTIQVHLVRVSNGPYGMEVRMAFDAPRHITIERAERQEKKESHAESTQSRASA